MTTKDVECSVCHKSCGGYVITCDGCGRVVCESCELKFCVEGYHAVKK